MTEQQAPVAGLSIDEMPWPPVELPPTDLPYDDGMPMESPWHHGTATLLMAGYIAARGGRRDDYFVGVNMFVYYSMRQVRNLDYRGPDVFVVKNVDAMRDRNSWIVWDEDGRYPDVIFELLSASTEKNDLTVKKQLYEQTFRTPEYFCVAPSVERLLGWRLGSEGYVPIEPNAHGWLWSQELELFVGPWEGTFLSQQRRWLRYYRADESLVLLADEAAEQQAAAEAERAQAAEQQAALEAERARAAEQQAQSLAERVAALEAELRRRQES